MADTDTFVPKLQTTLQQYAAVYRCRWCANTFTRTIPTPARIERYTSVEVLSEVVKIPGLQTAIHTCHPSVNHVAGLGELVGVREIRTSNHASRANRPDGYDHGS